MSPEERIKDIEEIITRSAPQPNEEALRKIREHVGQLRSAVRGGYQQNKLAEIIDWAEVYFSARKHRGYNGGAEQVAVWILGACGSVRDGLVEVKSGSGQ